MKTRWENTDNIDVTRNEITVTSKLTDWDTIERIDWFIKKEESEENIRQDIFWMTKPIEAISILQLADVWIKTKKTFKWKAGMVLWVWDDEKSIEFIEWWWWHIWWIDSELDLASDDPSAYHYLSELDCNKARWFLIMTDRLNTATQTTEPRPSINIVNAKPWIPYTIMMLRSSEEFDWFNLVMLVNWHNVAPIPADAGTLEFFNDPTDATMYVLTITFITEANIDGTTFSDCMLSVKPMWQLPTNI